MKSLFDNPELKRNIWLELSPTRLITMPFMLAAIFYLTYLSTNNIFEFMERLRTTSVVAFGLIVFLWGTKLVSESVVTEVNDKTWDSQRLTSISPLDMTIGKLFGSTLYTWYGGFFCAGAYIISALYLPDTYLRLKFFMVIILATLLSHAFSLNFSLLDIRRNRDKEKIRNSSFFGGLTLACVLVSVFMTFGIPGVMRKTENPVNWHGLDFFYSDFMLFTVIFFLLWSVVGVYRNMKTEFQMTNGPYVWLTFLISFMLYLSGFLSNAEDFDPVKYTIIALYISYAVGVFTTYIMAFSEPKQLVEFRFLADKAKKKQWKELGDNLPLWLITLGVTVILCVAVLILSLLSTPIKIKGYNNAYLPAFYALSVLCFLLRDISLLLYVNLKKDAKRADIATMVYLVILYGLAPPILAMSGRQNLLPMFVPIPMPDSNLINGTLPILIQCAITMFFLLNRWKAGNLEYKKG